MQSKITCCQANSCNCSQRSPAVRELQLTAVKNHLLSGSSNCSQRSALVRQIRAIAVKDHLLSGGCNCSQRRSPAVKGVALQSKITCCQGVAIAVKNLEDHLLSKSVAIAVKDQLWPGKLESKITYYQANFLSQLQSKITCCQRELQLQTVSPPRQNWSRLSFPLFSRLILTSRF